MITIKSIIFITWFISTSIYVISVITNKEKSENERRR